MIDTDWAEVVSLLHRGGECWHLCDDNQSFWRRVGDLTRIPTGRNLWYSVNPSARIPDTNSEGQPAPPRFVRAQLASLAAINCLYADFDGDKLAAYRQIEALPVFPTAIVDSGGGYHCYWLLCAPFLLSTDADRERARRLQALWVTEVCRGAEPGAKNLNRVLRWPGSYNMKSKYAPNFPKVTLIYYNPRALYHLADLEEFIPPPPLPPPRLARPVIQPSCAYAAAALERELATLREARPGDRNVSLNKAAYALGRLVGAGALSESEVRDILTAEGQQLGLSPREVSATVKSGLAAGRAKPRGVKRLSDSELRRKAAARWRRAICETRLSSKA